MTKLSRQTRVLVAEDWKAIYQSFRNAEFKSYDFDNLRRTLIAYLRENYPEDFNDYIESSEFIALIDMIAFLGQNLSFRVDLNARENFLETAERRESILRLAQMLAYQPKRNQAANGLLKFDSVRTTEELFDSNGVNLSGVTIRWNDPSNLNYLEQFIKILNAALPESNSFGNPLKSENILNVYTEQYRLNSFNDDLAVFPFQSSVDGRRLNFEAVSTAIDGNTIIEEPPLPGNSFSFLYRDDGQGPGSSNTGFFAHFRQGTLRDANFFVEAPVPNQRVDIDTANINDSDVWLYSIDTNDVETTLWTKLSAAQGNNAIFNSIFRNNKDFYTVESRIDDRISLLFSDGVFGNLPSGNFKIYFRTSINSDIVINKRSIQNVSITIPYISRRNTQETLSIRLSLYSEIANSFASETNDEIKSNAPATYYTQNRLITGEDYNIGIFGATQDVVKVKAVNRISSGISRYYDLSDPTGRYSNTLLFANDGIIYREDFNQKTTFKFDSRSDIEGIIVNIIEPLIASSSVNNFYLEKYERRNISDLNATWIDDSTFTNKSTGRFSIDGGSTLYKVGSFATNALRFIESDCFCKFEPPLTSDGKQQFILPNGTLTTNSDERGAVAYKWTKVVSVEGDGTTVNLEGNGPIVFNDLIPEGSLLVEIIPRYTKIIDDTVKVQIIDRVFSFREFGLRYDQNERKWRVILSDNLNTFNDFSTGRSGDTSGNNLDSSWIFWFKHTGGKYEVTYRNTRFVFESNKELQFFYEEGGRVFDPATSRVVQDKITVLGINRRPDTLFPFTQDYDLAIVKEYVDDNGFIDNGKVEIGFLDTDFDGVIDNPDVFKDIVFGDSLNELDKIVFKRKITEGGQQFFRLFDNTDQTIIVVENESAIGSWANYEDGQLFYIFNQNVFKQINKTLNQLVLNVEYKAFVGRSQLKFRYKHVAKSDRRIDPAKTNIIDAYILSRSYDNEFRNYIRNVVSEEPLPPSSDLLTRTIGTFIEDKKSISDEVIFHPARYKMLFGKKADTDLQVVFKIVKNKNVAINDNELKSEVIDAINNFFSLDLWDFGDTFYFQELSTFVTNQLNPRLVSMLIVPRRPDRSFGSLFEVKSDPDEIFISVAGVEDVEIIDEITSEAIQSGGVINTKTTRENVNIRSK